MKYYSPSEVSRGLDIPDSTLRRLAKQLSEFLTPQRGRKRRYSEQDIKTLQLARNMLSQGKTVEYVRSELSKIIEAVPPEEPPEVEFVDDMRAIPMEQALARIDDQYNLLQEVLERLGQERQADRERMRVIEEWLRLPWWRRLFTRPPE